MPGTTHVVRLQRPALGHALDLGDDDAAIVADGERLIERAEIGALVLIGEVAALVGRGGADDGDLRHDGGKYSQSSPSNSTFCTIGSAAARSFIAQPSRDGIDEGVEPDLGQHARALRRGLAVHVEHDAGGDVVGRDLVAVIICQISGGSAEDGPDG